MKALRIHGPKDVRNDNVDDPEIKESRDAIIRVTSTAICGSDLHIYNGSIPQPTPQTLGHEFMGIEEEVGKAVANLEKGSDKVLLACMSAVRRGGFVSVLGVYSSPFDNFPIHQFFDKGITLKGGQAPAHKHIDKLLKHVSNGDVKLNDIISHRLPLSQAPHAYDIFRNKKDNCTKVVLTPGA